MNIADSNDESARVISGQQSGVVMGKTAVGTSWSLGLMWILLLNPSVNEGPNALIQ
jgi:hypothetical protein